MADDDKTVSAALQAVQESVVTTAGAILTGAPPGTSTIVGVAQGLRLFYNAVSAANDEVLRRAIQKDQQEALEEVRDRVERNAQALEARGVTPSPSDVAAICDAWARAWRNADPQKRRVLKTAFVNAFDPELYESGLLIELFSIVDKLSYGDLRLLRVIVHCKSLPPPEAFDYSDAGLTVVEENLARSAPLGPHHLSKLREAGLVERRNRSHSFARPGAGTVLFLALEPSALGEYVSRLAALGSLEDDLRSA